MWITQEVLTNRLNLWRLLTVRSCRGRGTFNIIRIIIYYLSYLHFLKRRRLPDLLRSRHWLARASSIFWSPLCSSTSCSFDACVLPACMSEAWDWTAGGLPRLGRVSLAWGCAGFLPRDLAPCLPLGCFRVVRNVMHWKSEKMIGVRTSNKFH